LRPCFIACRLRKEGCASEDLKQLLKEEVAIAYSFSGNDGLPVTTMTVAGSLQRLNRYSQMRQPDRRETTPAVSRKDVLALRAGHS
jgi:hypothetical protein